MGLTRLYACDQCSKSCGSGSRKRTVLCLRNNATADLSQCGVDSIPFAEEKCNVDPCSSEDQEMTETTTPADDLIEVCEEIEEDQLDVEEVNHCHSITAILSFNSFKFELFKKILKIKKF